MRQIFAAKCIECHDSATARPKGDFGYVLDLARVAANPDWVTRGNAEDSDLYLMVENEEMPGDDATVPPLTTQEKDTVKRWIDAGAQASPLPNSAQKTPPRGRTDLPLIPRLIRALGQFHPPSAHFPIALLIAAFPAEVMWKRTRKPNWKSTVRFCVMLGAISAVLTALLGWCNASPHTGELAHIMEWHRWLGTGTAVWAVGLAIISEMAHKVGQPRLWRYSFRTTLVAGILLVSFTGYFGAALVYGIQHFNW
ncbi:MAG: DUF2231 domain-containing protein [Chthoniobacterales bacterium]